MVPDDEFARFADQHSEPLLRAARLLTGDWHAGSDLTQETLIRLYRAWPRLHDTSAANQYARQIMVRVFTKQRRRRWSSEIPYDVLPTDPAQGAPPDRDEELIRALAKLPPRQRAVLVFRFFLDMSVDATAQSMSSSAGTVKSQTSKALAHLRRELESTTNKECVS